MMTKNKLRKQKKKIKKKKKLLIIKSININYINLKLILFLNC